MKKKGKQVKLPGNMRTFSGDVLAGKYDVAFLKKTGQFGRTTHRRMRYWCYKLRHAEVDGKEITHVPDGVKEFVEGLPGFAGWKKFATTWDIHGENPFMTVFRLTSVWEDWDAVMKRVAIPINATPEEVAARVQILSDDYARKEAKRR